MRDLEKLIDEVNGSISREGMLLTQTDKGRIRRYADNDELVEETIVELIKKHTAIRSYSHGQQL